MTRLAPIPRPDLTDGDQPALAPHVAAHRRAIDAYHREGTDDAWARMCVAADSLGARRRELLGGPTVRADVMP